MFFGKKQRTSRETRHESTMGGLPKELTSNVQKKQKGSLEMMTGRLNNWENTVIRVAPRSMVESFEEAEARSVRIGFGETARKGRKVLPVRELTLNGDDLDKALDYVQDSYNRLKAWKIANNRMIEARSEKQWIWALGEKWSRVSQMKLRRKVCGMQSA